MHQGQATSGVERFLRRENRVSVSFGGGGGIAREKVCGCPLIHVEQGRRTCIASPSLYPTSPLNILTRRVRGCRPIGLALPPRAPRVDTRENQELLKPRQKCQHRVEIKNPLAKSLQVTASSWPRQLLLLSGSDPFIARSTASPTNPPNGVHSLQPRGADPPRAPASSHPSPLA